MTHPADLDRRDDDFDARLRGALDATPEPDRPPPAVRAAILAGARSIAADHAQAAGAPRPGEAPATRRPERRMGANDPRFRALSLAAAAALALLVAWPLQYLPTPPRRASGLTPAPQTLPTAKVEGSVPPSADTGHEPPRAAAVAPPTHERAKPPVLAAAAPSPRPLADSVPGEAASVAAKTVAASRADGQAPGPPMAVGPPAARAGPAPPAALAATRAASAPLVVAQPPTTQADTLAQAVAAGDEARVRALLAAGADVNEFDAGGRSALIVATEHRSLSMMRLLLAAGADANRAANSSVTPLSIARARHYDDAEALLREAGARD